MHGKKGFRNAVLTALLFGLFSCRNDVQLTDAAPGPLVRRQGIYQRQDETLGMIDCADGRLRRLQDTPEGQLRRQCALFDDLQDAVLWIDLEGDWRFAKDSIFVVYQIHRIERRRAPAGCQ